MKYNSNCHPCSETLPSDQQVCCVKVVKTLLRTGVSICKVHIFREFSEETGFQLTDKQYMVDLILFILKEVETNIKQEIKEKHVSVIFDGTTCLGDALAVVLHGQ